MKGIVGDLGEIKIPLNPDAKLVKQRPYRLNPCYKEKFRAELDRMLEAGVIEPVEESEWISLIVVQDKKTSGEVRICVDLRKLNDACLDDSFPTHSQMKYWRLLEDKKCIHLQMDSQVTIRFELPKKTTTRIPLQQNEDATNTR